MDNQYVLVSQGIEIYRTTNKELAESIKNEENKEYYKYCEECASNNEFAVDNEVFIFEED